MVTLERQNIWKRIKGSLLSCKLVFRLTTTVLEHTDEECVSVSGVQGLGGGAETLGLAFLLLCMRVCVCTPGRVAGQIFLMERQDLLSSHLLHPLLLGGLK